MKIKKNLAETLIYLGAYIGGAVWNCLSGMCEFSANTPASRRVLTVMQRRKCHEKKYFRFY